MTEDHGISSDESFSLHLVEENKHFFKLFKLLGLFPISCTNGNFIIDEKVCVITRILWFLWHLAGMICIAMIRITYRDHCSNMTNTVKASSGTQRMKDDCGEDLGDLNIPLIVSIGILVFILVDPVQTIILKRNINFLPKILKEVKILENINIGNHLSRKYKVSKVFMRNISYSGKPMEENSTEGYTNRGCIDSPNTITPQADAICESNLSEFNGEEQFARNKKFSKCYSMLRYFILGSSILIFLISFWWGFYIAVYPQENDMRHDIIDEWKLVGSLFYLFFPVITTWFCAFFIGYQRQMYKVINGIPDDQFYNEELIKDIGKYFESLQKLSKLLNDKIYRFTFGINFALFVIIGTMCTFELIQGLGEIRNLKEDKHTEFGDIIYLFPIAVCVFHIYISCQRSTKLISGQHDKLRYKLKGILTSLLVDKIETSIQNEKKFKRVELLYKNIKDFKPQPEVYGGFKVNYSLFTGMLIFIFTYSRIFYGYIGIPVMGNLS